MTGLARQLRHATRTLTRSPGLTAIAVITFGLGIGLTAVMFSIVYGALWRGLPFENADRILHLERTRPSHDIESIGVPLADYLDWREQQTSFVDLAAFRTGTVNLRGTERPQRYDGAFMTANAFRMLGVPPVLGRLFREGEDAPGAPPVVLLGYAVWRDQFDADPGVVGRVVQINGEGTTVVGVMPEGFRFPVLQDLWVPLRDDPADNRERDDGFLYEVFGVLRDGVSPDQAMAEFTGITRRLGAAYPETNEGVLPLIKPYTKEFIGDEESGLLLTMLATVSLVLLVACANVANLLLARAAKRTKEVAIRAAMGANRWQAVGQMVTEALALSAVGALLGLGVAWIGIRLFANAVVEADPPFWLEFQLDGPIVLFVTVITVLAGLLSGVIPAIKASGADVGGVLKDESRGSSSLRIGRLSRGLVVIEIALSAGLLVVAGLMIKSITNLRTLDLAFETETVFTGRVGLFETDYPDRLSRDAFWRELERRVAAIPGVEHAALGSSVPGTFSGTRRFGVEGEVYPTTQDYPYARYAAVTPGYFATFDVDVVAGRAFTEDDTEGSLPVAIVNESFARAFLAGREALGRRFRVGRDESDAPYLTVVGVVPDLWMQGLGNVGEEPAGFYTPLAQEDFAFLTVAARTRTDPLGITQQVRDEVMGLDPNLPVYWVDTLQGRIEGETWFYDIFGTLFAAFGVVALFLASVGLYGVMSFGVSNRTQEMGIRMALGARASQVLGMILGQGLGQISLGLVLGLGLAAFLSRGLQLLFFQVRPWDPGTFAAIAVVLALTGVLASAVPARRATRIDPMAALRYE